MFFGMDCVFDGGVLSRWVFSVDDCEREVGWRCIWYCRIGGECLFGTSTYMPSYPISLPKISIADSALHPYNPISARFKLSVVPRPLPFPTP